MAPPVAAVDRIRGEVWQESCRVAQETEHAPVLVVPGAAAAELLCQYCRWGLTHYHCPGCGRPSTDPGSCVSCDHPGPLLGLLAALFTAVATVVVVARFAF